MIAGSELNTKFYKRDRDQIMQIDIDVPDGKSGEWEVSSFVVGERELSQVLSMFKYGRGVPAGTYKRLTRKGTLVMSNAPDEISDFWRFVCRAKGSVLVNGLGLGVLLKALLNKQEITEVTVIEKSSEMKKLHKKYGRKTKYQESWCRYRCEQHQRNNRS